MSEQINELQLLESLYTEHYATVYRLASYMLRASGNSAEDAADLTHDTFLLAAKHIRTLSTHSNPGGWLYKTVRNLCLNYIRTSHTVPMGDPASLYADPQDPYAASNIRIAMEQELRPEEMSLFYDYYIKKRTDQELGHALGITAAAVRKRASRIRAKLRTLFILLVTFFPIHYI